MADNEACLKDSAPKPDKAEADQSLDVTSKSEDSPHASDDQDDTTNSSPIAAHSQVDAAPTSTGTSNKENAQQDSSVDGLQRNVGNDGEDKSSVNDLNVEREQDNNVESSDGTCTEETQIQQNTKETEIEEPCMEETEVEQNTKETEIEEPCTEEIEVQQNKPKAEDERTGPAETEDTNINSVGKGTCSEEVKTEQSSNTEEQECEATSIDEPVTEQLPKLESNVGEPCLDKDLEDNKSPETVIEGVSEDRDAASSPDDNEGGENSEHLEMLQGQAGEEDVDDILPASTVLPDHAISMTEDQLEDVDVELGIAVDDKASVSLTDISTDSGHNSQESMEDLGQVDSRVSPIQADQGDDPECDLVSEEGSKGSESLMAVSHSDNATSGDIRTAAPLNRVMRPKEPSSLRGALGQLKQGIKSATKENSPIREALGQMKQGLRSAISETSTFLEGPSAPRPIPLPGYVSISEPTLYAAPKSSSQGVRPAEPSATADLSPVEERQGGGDTSSPTGVPEDELLSELDAELDQPRTRVAVVERSGSSGRLPPPPRPPPPNGMRQLSLTDIPEYKELKATCEQLRKELLQQKEQTTRVLSVHEAQDNALLQAKKETETYKKQIESLKSKSSEDIFIAQIKALEITIASQQKEIKAGQEKLQLHDKAAKEAVAKLHAEIKARSDQYASLTETAKKDKGDMVLKYAKAESKNIEMEQRMTKNDARMKEMTKERETALGKFKTLKADQVKCRELFEARSTEVVHLRREYEKQKELLVSQEGKTKWAHNKLRQEIDAHKDTRAKLEEAVRKNKTSRDEAEQIRRDCQSMIKCYQESEEIKSNSLDQELKNKETELMQHKQEKLDHQEIHNLTKRELETLKMKHKEMMEELKTWRDKKTLLDAERIIQEQNLNKYRETLQKQKETNQALEKRLADLSDIEKVVLEVKAKNSEVELRNEEMGLESAELRADMDRCTTREQEHLQFTQKISDKNARLQSENSAFTNKVTGLVAENERITAIADDLKKRKELLEKELNTERKLRTKTCEDLSSQLAEKTKEVERLTVEIDDAQNEIKTLKRKHAANTKDLMRQLQSAKRRLESVDAKDGQSSMGSRTSSNGSLDAVNGSRSGVAAGPPQVEPEPFVEIAEVDKQMLIEKIVRLQKAHARKNEKLEFMEDHIQQLFTEVQKKTKIIQNYALREEAGTISPDSADTNKALLAKKGGIMASVYTSHQQDGAMTLDLSLDINRKLQAVLEDTILKNITLKENLDTLGEEIARLSQENRAIQLNSQQQSA